MFLWSVTRLILLLLEIELSFFTWASDGEINDCHAVTVAGRRYVSNVCRRCISVLARFNMVSNMEDKKKTEKKNNLCDRVGSRGMTVVSSFQCRSVTGTWRCLLPMQHPPVSKIAAQPTVLPNFCIHGEVVIVSSRKKR